MSLRVTLLVLCAAAIVYGAIVWAGKNPVEAGSALIEGSLGSKGAIHGTIKSLMPLIIAGLAVFLALRAGLFNIGVEGQLVVGAMVCAVVALNVKGIAGMVLGCFAGAIAGALWAWPAGWIKAYKGGHEVISTIMLNNVAGFLAAYLTAGPIKAPGEQNTTTARIATETMLPALYQSLPLKISSGLAFGVALLVALNWWLKRTVSGYELSLTGANARAAELAGVDTKRVILRSMAVSGALAGLAGAIQVLGYEGRFYAGFSPGYGFDALGVAILAGGSAYGIFPAALLFAILDKGSASVQLIGVPKGIGVVLVGLLIVVFAAIRFRREQVHE